MEVRSIDELIEALEAIRAEIQPRRLSSEQYLHVGWADRHLRELIDRARDELDRESWDACRRRLWETGVQA